MTSSQLRSLSSYRQDGKVRDDKVDVNLLESTNCDRTATYAESVGFHLPSHHRDYLMKRHGTLELDPIPGIGPADPLNWPEWKVSLHYPLQQPILAHQQLSKIKQKTLGSGAHKPFTQKTGNLILVAFHACMSTLTAAAIVPAYSEIATQLSISLQKASYLSSLQIAIIGGAPLFWRPLSNRLGRRPIFLLSLICSLVCNVGCAKSTTYASLAACRALGAFFISPAAAIGSAVVLETTFKKDRARYMGIWTLMVTLGVPLGCFIFGFITYRAGYIWIYWTLAMVCLRLSSL